MRMIALLLATLALGFPALAQDRSNPASARLAATICLDLYAGRTSTAALAAGFREARRGYVRRATALGLNGHTDHAEVLLTGRNRTCTYDYRSNRGASAAFEAFTAQLRTSGLTEGRLGNKTAFQIAGEWRTLYASSGSQNGSFRTLISLEKAR